jgi:hypothetical protein
MGETVWLSLGQMVDLFQRDKLGISRPIKNFLEGGNSSGTQLLQNLQQLPPTGREVGSGKWEVGSEK